MGSQESGYCYIMMKRFISRGELVVRKVLLGCLVCLLLVPFFGCTTNFNISGEQQQAVIKIERGKSVYIALSKDGTYHEKIYPGTGKQVSGFLNTALRGFAGGISLASLHQPEIERYFEAATEKNAYYLFVPEILHWEPRAAAWSGIAPEAEITFSVYAVETQELLVKKSLKVKGRTMTATSQHIHDLVKLGIPDLIKALY